MTDVVLSAEEARVLGCLMEKAVTTPDGYPLSINALINACNQSTNRDPVVSYDESTVERALESLREKNLSRRVRATGQRVVKHRHIVDETLQLHVPEFAILGVLLLRGPQTPGELKQRTERWHSFRSLDDVEETLQRLGGRGFVQQAPRRPGQKESRWATLLVESNANAASEAPVAAPAPPVHEAPPVREPAEAPVREERSLDVRNPATGQRIRSVAVTEEGEIAQKVVRARRAQPQWAAREYSERARALQGFAALLESECDELARITTEEMGKPITQSRNEVRAVVERVTWNVDNVERILAPRAVTSGSIDERVTHEPVGVVAHISAWNYPYFVALNTIVPALLAGNVVLYKPSEHATLTGLRLVDMLHRSGVPVDAVQAVVGGGATGSTLVASDVDMICFTGSYDTGRKVAAAAADRLMRVQLELGGKDAAYVCDDVEVDKVAELVVEGAMYNAGQSCSAIERVYVHERIWDRFVEELFYVAQREVVGDPGDDSTTIGPLARAEQLDALEAQVADAVAKGAQCLLGGERLDRPGNWFPPTLLVDCDDRMSVMREESFGPVLPLARVRDDDEAIARMDDTEYGLGAAVFTADVTRAERVLARLDVGNAYVNTSDRSCVRLPWAGRRHSGTGVSMSESGVRALVREKAWHVGS